MTQAEKVQRLTQMTYKQYLQYYWGCPDEAFFGEYWRGSGSLLGAGGQAVSAARLLGARPARLPVGARAPEHDRHRFPGIGRTPQQDSKSGQRPDARLAGREHLAAEADRRKLIPAAQPDVNGARPDAADDPAVEDGLHRSSTTRPTTSASG